MTLFAMYQTPRYCAVPEVNNHSSMKFTIAENSRHTTRNADSLTLRRRACARPQPHATCQSDLGVRHEALAKHSTSFDCVQRQ